MTETVAPTFSLDLDDDRITRIDVEDWAAIELLRDLVIAEHERQTGAISSAIPTTLADALQMALRRFAARPYEPVSPAARVTGTRTGEEPCTYAKIGAVWVSPADTAGREWADLVVEYDELEVVGT